MAKPRIRIGRTHCILPDVQTRPGVGNDHLSHVGQYIAEKRPDVVVCIGDFADMPSLSPYDEGKVVFEGARYVNDLKAAHVAMEKLMKPIKAVRGYKPEMLLTLGNHEERINRHAEANPRLKGLVSVTDLEYEKWGWEVAPFLKIMKKDGIMYSHYFTSGVMGRPVSSARAILSNYHASGVMGHVQTVDIAIHPRSGHIGMFVGCCYTHDEKYLTEQGNTCRRQIVMLHEVHQGIADPMLVSLEFLKRKYS